MYVQGERKSWETCSNDHMKINIEQKGENMRE